MSTPYVKSSSTRASWLAACIFAPFIVSCGNRTDDPSMHGATLQDMDIRTKRIGESYNAGKTEFLNTSCLSIPEDAIEFKPPNNGEVKVDVSVPFEDLEKILNIDGELKINLDAFLTQRSANFALKMQATPFASTIVIHKTNTGGYYAIKDTSRVQLNDLGKSALESPKAKQIEDCGTHYVKQKHLASNFIAVMKFEFQNEQQKQTFDDELKTSFKDLGDISGKVEKLTRMARRSASFSLNVTQLGGNSSQLPKILDGESMMGCVMRNDPNSCAKQISKIITYAEINLPEQFNDPQIGFAHVNEVIASYSDIPGWTGTLPNEISLRSLAVERQTLRNQIIAEKGDFLRAQALLKNAESISNVQAQKLNALSRTITSRIGAILDASRECFNISLSSIDSCENAVDKLSKDLDFKPELQIDRTALIVIPHSYLGWCSAVKQWYEVGIVKIVGQT